MKFRAFLIAIGILWIAGAAIAQTQLLPALTGTRSDSKNMIDFVGMLRLNRNETLTATASGTLANSVVLNFGLNRFTTVTTGGDSATLPTLAGGVMVVVVNSTVTSMNVFPNAAASTINALSAGTAFAVAAGKTAIFFQANDGNWYAVLTA